MVRQQYRNKVIAYTGAGVAGLCALAAVSLGGILANKEAKAVDRTPRVVTAVSQLSMAVDTAAIRQVFRELQTDLQNHEFAVPDIQLRVAPGGGTGATAYLESNVIELQEGLLRIGLTANELYAVMGHESFHLVHNAQRAWGQGEVPVPPMLLLTEKEQQARELQADADTQYLMRKVGRDPQALSRALIKLYATPTQTPSTGTHPTLASRLRALNAEAMSAERPN